MGAGQSDLNPYPVRCEPGGQVHALARLLPPQSHHLYEGVGLAAWQTSFFSYVLGL